MPGKWTTFDADWSTALEDKDKAPTIKQVNIINKHNDDQRIYLDVMVNNVTTKALLDTGATISVFGAHSHHLWPTNTNVKKDNRERVITANGNDLTCMARIKIPITYKGITKIIKVLIVPEVLEQVILGINFFHAFNLNIKHQVATITSSEVNQQTNDIDLTNEQRDRLKSVLQLFLYSSDSFVGCQTKIQHHIDTGDQKPICQRLYQYSPDIEEKIKCEIDRWLRLGYIEAANTDWRHPIVPVTKKNGKIRLCLDARKLNSITKRDTYTSPDLNHIFRRFPEAKLFFSVDLTDAFLQTELTESSKEKTAFGIPGKGCFQYKRMPFGLKNAAATQSRVMNMILGEDLEPRVFHYLDDVVISAKTFEELLELISEVAKRLTSSGLSVNPDKLEGPCSRIKFIGRIFDCDGQHPEEAKIEAIKNWPTPRTVREVRSLVGTVTWYSHFIKNFSSLMAPITSLIKKKAQKVNWTEEAELAFTKIKEALTSQPILRPPNYAKSFMIQCDASQYGVGAVLVQLDDDEKEYVISYYSHKLTKEEQKYHAYERECLAVLKGLDHFKPYVYLQPIVIVTDHHSLTQTLKYKGKSGRLLRWSLMLQPHAHQIIHRSGSQMIVADALSRARPEAQEIDDDTFNHYQINVLQVEIADSVEPLSDEEINIADRVTRQFEELRRKIVNNPDAYLNYRVQNNRVFKKIENRDTRMEDWLEIPHPTQRMKVIDWAHNEVLHAGVDKTVDKIFEYFFWKGIFKDVAKNIKSCVKCAQIKFPNYSARGIMPIFHLPKEVGTEIRIDFKGPFPQTVQHKYRFIVVAQEALSRYLIAECLTRATVDNTIRFLREKVLNIFPNVRIIRHDRGSQFMSETFKEFLIERDIKAVPTASYAPHQNPVERANRSIGEALTLFMLKFPETHSNWHRFVNTIISKINNRKHDATKLRPNMVAFGQLDRDQHVNAEVQQRIINMAYENSKRMYESRMKEHNKHASRREFNEGEMVMAKYRTLSSGGHNWMSKLAAKYYPVKILKKLGHNTYEVVDVNGTKHTLDVRSISNVVPELQDILKDIMEHE